MKRILVTGTEGYIARSFLAYMKPFGADYQVDALSVRDEQWRSMDFSGYDVVLHLAGLAHGQAVDEAECQRVNGVLACALAQKAMDDGVAQFILLSTLAVYGLDCGEITSRTPLKPSTAYGRSKRFAEVGMPTGLSTCIVRAPMVYGFGCPGNYARLSKLSRVLPVFPAMDNRRSMIYVEHLCACFRRLIDTGATGVVHPQNPRFVSTSALVGAIARVHRRKIHFVTVLNPLLQALMPLNGTLRKVFGSLTVEASLSEGCEVDALYSFEQTIQKTEGRL